MNVLLAPATQEDAGDFVDLLVARPPAFWMRQASPSDLRRFADYAIGSPRCVLLLARPAPGAPAAGYILAFYDARRFWLRLALRHPSLMRRAVVRRFRRRAQLEREIDSRAADDPAMRALPLFSWSPSAPETARIFGLFVRPEHRWQGIAPDLYFGLLDALKQRGVANVEEYLRPDTPVRSMEAWGWRVQKCRCRGFKVTKAL